MAARVCLAGIAIVAAACAHNVRQDAASGRDGTQAGARVVRVDRGTAAVTGVVTYPGGDRVDWVLLELPEQQHGALELRLVWTPPRPGLQLGFEVFDASNQPVAQSATPGGSDARRTAMIEDAAGGYYVRIYALERGDAGTYRLTATFRPAPGPAAQ